MFDLHSHFLPGIDDGPGTLSDTLDILRAAVADGIEGMVATPHRKDVTEKLSIEALRFLFEDVTLAAHRASIHIDLHLGMENHLSADLPQQLDDGFALTMGSTSYILVEIPFLQYPDYIDDTVRALKVRGLTPIIAHPERQEEIQRRPNLLRDLIDIGVVSQITAGSVLGDFGLEAKFAAKKLAENGLVHLIATDTHSPRGWRIPNLTSALAQMSKWIGENQARDMVLGIPEFILNGNQFKPTR